MIQLTFKQPAMIDTQRNYVSAVQADVPYLMTNYTGRVARLRFPELAGAGRIGGRVFVFQG